MMKAKKQPELGCLLDCVCTHANTMRPVNQEAIKLLIFFWTAMLASKCCQSLLYILSNLSDFQ